MFLSQAFKLQALITRKHGVLWIFHVFALAFSWLRKEKKKKKESYVGRETTPYINQGKGDTLTRRAVSLLLQGEEQVRIWRLG